MARTIEELIAAHFKRSIYEKFTQKQQPGEPIDAALAAKFCERVSERQLVQIDPQTIEALDAVLTEGAETLDPHKMVADIKKVKAFEWFKKRRSPELEKSFVTLLIVAGVVRDNWQLSDFYIGRNAQFNSWIASMADAVGKRSLKLDVYQLFAALESRISERHINRGVRFEYACLHPLMDALEKLRESIQPDEAEAKMLQLMRNQFEKDGYGSNMRVWKEMIDQILAGGKEIEAALLWEGEAWAKKINESIRALPDAQRRAAIALLKYAGTVQEYTKPAKAWFTEGQKIIDAMGKAQAASLMQDWLRVYAQDAHAELAAFQEHYQHRHADPRAVHRPRLHENTNDIAGLAYLSRCAADQKSLLALADLVETIARAKHVVREPSLSVATGALRSIEASDDPSAVACLSRLALRLRYPKLRKAAEKAYAGYLDRHKISRDDADETSVPDFDMTDGIAKIKVADHEAIIALGRGDRPTLTWQRPDKPPTHILPKALKASHPDEVKSIAQTVDDIEKTMAAQRTRIDLMFRREISWPYATWKQRYFDHGLLGPFVRRLIWNIDGAAAINVHGAWQNLKGNAVEPRDDATISLWHPALRAADEVLAWRLKLESLGITQPMKQAHREVYLLTDAERNTRTYSNRYAAHIVKNHATLAISQVRKWKMGMYGGASSPSLELPHFGLRAEWWLEAAGPETDRMGFPLYLASDQVRFYERSETEPMELSRVPPLALTEVMRDIDLFVGIASVGNDPNWRDGQHTGRYHDYWSSYSFGELSATAKTRREVLHNLLQRLTKIRERCSVDDKFLVVRGDLRTYKIHLGSGNILMLPNDQYLCIVPDRGSRDAGNDVFLPFEGDATLSIILSKAFLLADDSAIQDPTIMRQIQHATHPIDLA